MSSVSGFVQTLKRRGCQTSATPIRNGIRYRRPKALILAEKRQQAWSVGESFGPKAATGLKDNKPFVEPQLDDFLPYQHGTEPKPVGGRWLECSGELREELTDIKIMWTNGDLFQPTVVGLESCRNAREVFACSVKWDINPKAEYQDFRLALLANAREADAIYLHFDNELEGEVMCDDMRRFLLRNDIGEKPIHRVRSNDESIHTIKAAFKLNPFTPLKHDKIFAERSKKEFHYKESCVTFRQLKELIPDDPFTVGLGCNGKSIPLTYGMNRSALLGILSDVKCGGHAPKEVRLEFAVKHEAFPNAPPAIFSSTGAIKLSDAEASRARINAGEKRMKIVSVTLRQKTLKPPKPLTGTRADDLADRVSSGTMSLAKSEAVRERLYLTANCSYQRSNSEAYSAELRPHPHLRGFQSHPRFGHIVKQILDKFRQSDHPDLFMAGGAATSIAECAHEAVRPICNIRSRQQMLTRNEERAMFNVISAFMFATLAPEVTVDAVRVTGILDGIEFACELCLPHPDNLFAKLLHWSFSEYAEWPGEPFAEHSDVQFDSVSLVAVDREHDVGIGDGRINERQLLRLAKSYGLGTPVSRPLLLRRICDELYVKRSEDGQLEISWRGDAEIDGFRAVHPDFVSVEQCQKVTQKFDEMRDDPRKVPQIISELVEEYCSLSDEFYARRELFALAFDEVVQRWKDEVQEGGGEPDHTTMNPAVASSSAHNDNAALALREAGSSSSQAVSETGHIRALLAALPGAATNSLTSQEGDSKAFRSCPKMGCVGELLLWNADLPLRLYCSESECEFEFAFSREWHSLTRCDPPGRRGCRFCVAELRRDDGAVLYRCQQCDPLVDLLEACSPTNETRRRSAANVQSSLLEQRETSLSVTRTGCLPVAGNGGDQMQAFGQLSAPVQRASRATNTDSVESSEPVDRQTSEASSGEGTSVSGDGSRRYVAVVGRSISSSSQVEDALRSQKRLSAGSTTATATSSSSSGVGDVNTSPSKRRRIDDNGARRQAQKNNAAEADDSEGVAHDHRGKDDDNDDDDSVDESNESGETLDECSSSRLSSSAVAVGPFVMPAVFACPECAKQDAKLWAVLKHFNEDHCGTVKDRSKPYTCPECRKMQKTRKEENMRRHYARHIAGLLSASACPKCGFAHNGKSKFASHLSRCDI